MTAALYMECDTSGDWGSMRVFGWFSLLLYVLAFPVVFGLILVRHRNDLEDADFTAACQCMYYPFRKRLFWFELTIFLRRAFSAMIITLLPASSQVLAVSLCVVLASAVLLHAVCRPYVSTRLNALEGLALLVVCLTYVSGLIFSSSSMQNSDFNAFVEQVNSPFSFIY